MGTVNLTSSGSIFVSGTSSGINTGALIDASVAQRTIEADRIDVRISENSSTISAYQELQTLASAVESSLSNLKSVVSFSGLDSNIYSTREGTVASSTGADPNGIATISIDENADIASYDIIVQQSAESLLVTGSNQPDATSALGLTGSFELSLTGGAAQQIDITAGQSLNDIAAAINAVQADSGVSARVIQVSETDFQLVLEAEQSNRDIVFNQVAGDNVLNTLGVVDGGGAFQNVLRNFQPAIISLDGVTTQRDDNLFDDLIPGVTIDINNADPATTLTLDITNNVSGTKSAIEGFISAYNDLKAFILQNQQVNEDGQLSDDAALFGDSILSNLNNVAAQLVGGQNTSGVGTIRSIGIQFDSNGQLTIADESLLDETIINNYENIQSFFASSYTSSDAQFAILSNTSSGSDLSINFDITVDGGGNVTSVTANGDNAAFTFSGTVITGAAGTIYEGLSFSYLGGVNTSLTFDLQQGLADKLSNALSEYSDSVDGIIQEQIDQLQSTNDDLTIEAGDIRTRAEEFRASEISRYAQFEAQLERLKLLQGQLRALFGVENDN